MSSNGSPILTFDFRRQRAQPAVALILILLAALGPFLMGSAIDAGLRSACALLMAVGAAWAFRIAGWLGGPLAVSSIVWDRDGMWRLMLRDGRQCEGHLRADTRMSPAAIWLVWAIEAESGPAKPRMPRSRTLLVSPRDLPAGDFRRLLVRLRVDRSECAPTAQQTDPTLSS